jgi:pimeloyl-ACP methyl ester carboxylesterase
MDREVIAIPRSQSLLLPSGRHIGIAEQGDPYGVPILFFHGFVGSRLQCPSNGTVAGSLGARVIAVDRPGIGLSDPHTNRKVLDWTEDVKQLATVLQLERFAIIGWSAGAPYALACAYRMPQQVVALALASPMGGWFLGPGATHHISDESRHLMQFVHYAPWMLHFTFAALQRDLVHDARRVAEKTIREMPAKDRATFADAALHQLLVDTAGEPFRTGTVGVYEDTLAVAHPWGFALEDVATPVWIWHGDADTTVLPALATELAQRLPHAQFTLLPEEGHFLIFTHWHTILETLVQAFTASSPST